MYGILVAHAILIIISLELFFSGLCLFMLKLIFSQNIVMMRFVLDDGQCSWWRFDCWVIGWNVIASTRITGFWLAILCDYLFPFSGKYCKCYQYHSSQQDNGGWVSDSPRFGSSVRMFSTETIVLSRWDFF